MLKEEELTSIIDEIVLKSKIISWNDEKSFKLKKQINKIKG